MALSKLAFVAIVALLALPAGIKVSDPMCEGTGVLSTAKVLKIEIAEAAYICGLPAAEAIRAIRAPNATIMVEGTYVQSVEIAHECGSFVMASIFVTLTNVADVEIEDTVDVKITSGRGDMTVMPLHVDLPPHSSKTYELHIGMPEFAEGAKDIHVEVVPRGFANVTCPYCGGTGCVSLLDYFRLAATSS